MNELEDACHDGSREWRWAFRKPADEFIEELFRTDLQVKRISASLNESVEKCERQHGDMGISMIDEPDGQHRSLPGPVVMKEIGVNPMTLRTAETHELAFF